MSHFRAAADLAGEMVDMAYNSLEGSEDLERYHQRHGTPSLLILTQHSPEVAAESVRLIREQVEGKTVVEVGAGVGFLALELARIARHLYAIESDPAWSWIFTRTLYSHKPPNLTWIFGTAESVAHLISADVALIYTRSGVDKMRQVGYRMAPTVLTPLDSRPAELKRRKP